jgi:RIO kinase 1
MTRSDQKVRPVPPGIITEDYTEDEEIGLLKSGKEADVFLFRRHGADRSCLLAAKRYRPVDQRAFRNDSIYRAHRRIDGLVRDGDHWRRPKGGRGTQKAMDQRTGYGMKVLAERWIDAEYEMLTALWSAGAPVPYPAGRLDDGILMEFIGDEERAAPRLVDTRVDRAALPGLFEQLREAMRTFVQAGIVHADLSPYNTLLWDDVLWIIDLPQAVTILDSGAATDLLHHDVMTMCAWFTRKGLDVDAEQLFVDLIIEMSDLQMRDLFHAGG